MDEFFNNQRRFSSSSTRVQGCKCDVPYQRKRRFSSSSSGHWSKKEHLTYSIVVFVAFLGFLSRLGFSVVFCGLKLFVPLYFLFF